MSYIQGLANFIKVSPVSFNAVEATKKILNEYNFTELQEGEDYVIERGCGYYVTRNDSTIIAFKVGRNFSKESALHLVATHSDSPCFKIKPEMTSISGGYRKLNVEAYGGMLCSTFLDRPLSIAGRVSYLQDGNIKSAVIDLDEPLLMIPNLCIHFNREVNKDNSYDIATTMQPFVNQNLSENFIYHRLESHLNIKKEDILNYDLYIYNHQEATIWGENKEYISAPRLDNLECMYASILGLIHSDNDEDISIIAAFDNEEVGSTSFQGADSDFLKTTLARVTTALGLSSSEFNAMCARSYLISADNAHATHPNFSQYSDPTHPIHMNKGIVIKFNAYNSYTTDGISASIFQMLCKNSNVPYQMYTNKANIRGGFTLGHISLTQLSIKSADIGLGQLAMHSAYETAGCQDFEDLVKVLINFFSSNVQILGNTVSL